MKAIFPTAWDDQGTRKTAFADIFTSYAAHAGYTVGNSLKVQGAYAFEMRRDGVSRRIGLKSSYDRWLNTAQEMVKKVDEVWVTTFRWSDPTQGDEVPTHLEIYRIAPEDLLAKFKRVHDARAKAGKSNAMAYMPLDAAGIQDPDVAHYNKAGGYLLDTAELLFEAPLVFSDRGAARVEEEVGTPASVSPQVGGGNDIATLVYQHKQALAKIYGTTPDKIKILIEA